MAVTTIQDEILQKVILDNALGSVTVTVQRSRSFLCWGTTKPYKMVFCSFG